jgi:hypothetical protein
MAGERGILSVAMQRVAKLREIFASKTKPPPEIPVPLAPSLASVSKVNPPSSSSEIRLAGFGYSHIFSILTASKLLDLEGLGVSVSATLLSQTGLPPIFLPDVAPELKFTPEFCDLLEAAAEGADVVFLCIAGNAHQTLSLVNHPMPFDFVLKERPGLPLNQQSEIVPSRLVAEALINQGGYVGSIRILKAFVKYFVDQEIPNRPIVQCALPPIIPSAAHIHQYPAHFRELIEQYGVTPELIRYKLWKLHSQLVEAECINLGIQYVAVPSSMLDEHEFLVKDAWPQDSVHANERYGIRVLEQLIRLKAPSFSLPDAS